MINILNAKNLRQNNFLFDCRADTGLYIYIYLYSSITNAINANCLIIDDSLLLCNKDSQVS